MNDPSDDEIVERERRRWRIWSRVTIWTFLLWFGVAILLVVALNAGIPQRLGTWAGIPEWVAIWFPLILLGFLWLFYVLYRVKFAPAPAALRPSVQRKLVDDLTRRQRWTLAAFIPLMLLMAGNQIPARIASGNDAWIHPALFVFFVLITALMLIKGPGFLSPRFRAANADELSRALRGRAASVGYVIATLAMGADYIISLFAPQMLASAIPLSMAAVFIIPALYFLWCDWRASRDG
jgi:hypothetical protein